MEYHVYWLLKSSCFELFGDGEYSLYGAKKLMERWYLLITEKFLFWTFRRWELRSFFQPKSWWKYDIYWLLKSSSFELFGDGKYILFLLAKKLMERLYLLGLFELSMIFQDLGNMVFCGVIFIWVYSGHLTVTIAKRYHSTMLPLCTQLLSNSNGVVKYLCKICQKSVVLNHNSIQCDRCDIWVYKMQ